MSRVTLQSLIGPKKAAAPVIASLLRALGANACIEDAEGRLLHGPAVESPAAKYPVVLDGTTLGWVSGPCSVEAIATLLTLLARQEAEKKNLGVEVLNLYREVNLIYQFSEKLAALLDVHSVAGLSLEQARQMITASGGSLMLLHQETGRLETVASFGQAFPAPDGIPMGAGMIGALASRGNAEIVNEVRSDPRYVEEGHAISSLICAPLRVTERVKGVIVLVSATPVTYMAADLKMLNALALQTATAIENARLYERMLQAAKDREQLLALYKELEVARTIQQSIVPRTFPPFPERKDFEILAEMTPANEVGGDFFDFFLIGPEWLGFVIGDVSGKGVPAALFMAVTRTLLRATGLQGSSPDQCLQQVNRTLASERVSNLFVTALYGILNTRTGEVTYCSAGHNPPYALRGGGLVEELEPTGGLVLGLDGEQVYETRQIVLQAGEGLFLYTDGITEAMDRRRRLYTDGRLEACLRRCSGAALEEIIREVAGEVKTFADGAPQADDMTMLVLRRLA